MLCYSIISTINQLLKSPNTTYLVGSVNRMPRNRLPIIIKIVGQQAEKKIMEDH